MLSSEYSGENCSVARALEVVGERWTLLIVRDLLSGPHRFAELQRKLGIAKNVLAIRLQKLVDAGIVRKTPYTELRVWNDFRLTLKVHSLFPLLFAIMTR